MTGGAFDRHSISIAVNNQFFFISSYSTTVPYRISGYRILLLTLLQMFLIFQKQIPELESFLFAICNLQKLLMTLAGL